MSDHRDEPTGQQGFFPAPGHRSPHGNLGTRILGVEGVEAAPFEHVFARVFPQLLEIHRAFPQDGVLMAAVWRNHVLDGYLHVPLESVPVHVVMGRHERCDLVLPQDPAVSLRHAVIGVSRVGVADLRVRLWDLASGIGFRTEDDIPCEGLVAEGAVFVRVGAYHLFLLPTGDVAPFAWSGKAEETWRAFPERVYLDRRIPTRARGVRVLPPAPAPEPAIKRPPGDKRDSAITHIVPAPRPLRARRKDAQGEGVVVGSLQLAAKDGEIAYAVHDVELDHGLLVGRYERCQLGGIEKGLSRIHLLLVRDGDRLWAIDTASTNGTTDGDQEIRHLCLGPHAELVLASALRLRWDLQGRGEA